MTSTGSVAASTPTPTSQHSAARTRQSFIDRMTSPGGLFLSAVMLAAAFPLTAPIRDPDFWWHLRSGQLILQNGSLLHTDPFTYTVSSHVWTMHEWLSEVLFAELYHWGGLAAVVLVLSVVSWLGVLCILGRARLDRPGPFALGIGMVLAVIAGYPIWGPRAQMITFAFACLTLLLAERHLREGGRLALLLLPTFLVWGNLHSGFLIGLGFITVIVVAETVAHLLHIKGRAPAARVRSLALILLGSLVVCAINLNGPSIILYPFGTLGSAAQQSLILEWHSPDFHDRSVRTFGVMLLSLVAFIVANRSIRLRDAALVLVTVVLALQSVRHIALFVAAATPVWITQAEILLARLRRGPRRQQKLPPVAMRVVSWAVLCGAVLGVYVGSRLLPSMHTREDSLFYAQDFPVCAARWLAADPLPLKVFNQYGEGGYLADKLSAHGDRVYIFGDAALMGDELLYSYGDVESVTPRWDSIVRAAGTDVVLFDSNAPLSNVMIHASDWVQVYRDAHNIAFAPKERVASLQLPPQPPFTAPNDTCTTLAQTPASRLDQQPG
ncbi:MAG: hypothetical protein DLM65_03940 [Candidatus Aeolococcus gillhamiae]|uniref:Glycosyltransferase RgtA/B/C/D-like domain-containing protein n=1 Tax=Candidatus Aeolococcus gillhamiae TaxID=3127015 RepID=A0A2W5ZAJ1_9BACT|nr:MAG: hypothetical protein DLM65_03940 [Candidatus Dormibacter sp. RRmetagenome_bin12]